MALCDELEAKQKQKRTKAVVLNKAALSAVVHAPGKSQLKGAWSRVQDHFEVLYELPENVDELRLGILDLASKGLLQEHGRGEPATLRLQEKRQAIRDLMSEPLHAVTEHVPTPTLPPGWGVERIEYLGEDPLNPVQTGPFGAQLHKNEFVADGVPVVAVGNLTGTGFTDRGLYFITREKSRTLARYSIEAGDLLFARSGATTGKVCVAPAHVNDWRMTGHILRVRVDRSLMLPELLVYWIWGSDFVKQQIMGNIRGGTRPGYNTRLLKRIVVPVPPLSEQKLILGKVDLLMGICDELEAKLAQHRDQGQRLMQAVVEGLVA
jgi:type I restriction enzyme S subunit